MSEFVSLPALGESVTEGTITRWLKKVGDRVEVDEPLLEVSTDKVDTEIPSPISGVVEEIIVDEDETVEVGAALVRIGDGTATTPTEPSAPPVVETPAPPQAAQPQPPAETPTSAPEVSAPVSPPAPAAPQVSQPLAPAPVSAQHAPQSAASPPPVSLAQQQPVVSGASLTGSEGPTYVTPLVRKLAQEKGVDLSTLKGTGIGGRIRKDDVLAATTGPVSPSPAKKYTPQVSPLRGTTVPMSRLRKVVAERAVASMQTTAQLTSVVEADVTAVARLRDAKKAAFLTQTGMKLTFLPFFAQAATEALQTYPIINATVDGENIVYPPNENISIAVDTERGLLTPVIRDAASHSITDFAREIADLAARTRDNKLKPDELAGGTFTLTNTGSRGALFDTPVVFSPQSAILGTGIVTKKPVVITVDGQDSIAIRSTVFLALSYDHRIIDGADAARFLVAVKNRLEAAEFTDLDIY